MTKYRGIISLTRLGLPYAFHLFIVHSQTMSCFIPCFCDPSATVSRLTLSSNFFYQNSTPNLGLYAYLQPRCLCQKQSCTNIAVLTLFTGAGTNYLQYSKYALCISSPNPIDTCICISSILDFDNTCTLSLLSLYVSKLNCSKYLSSKTVISEMLITVLHLFAWSCAKNELRI